jgi:hypothetical protein
MLIRVNRTRADYLAKFEALIESYNAGSRNIDELFKELLALSRDLSDEEQRHVREQLSEEPVGQGCLPPTRSGPAKAVEGHQRIPAFDLLTLRWSATRRPATGFLLYGHSGFNSLSRFKPAWALRPYLMEEG